LGAISDLDVARLRLGDLEFRINNYIEENIQQWAEDEILELAQKKAYARGLSDSAIGNIYITKTGPMSVSLIWDYRGPNNEPISKFLEEGTISHFIYPKGKEFGGADALSWMDKNGKRVFRRKVRHPGTKPMYICRDAISEGKPRLSKRIRQEVERYLKASRIG